MTGAVELDFGKNSVRFTSDGMIFIEDAIEALADKPMQKPSAVWRKIETDHPGINDHCGSFATEDGELFKTIDIEGLDKMFLLLPEYM